MNTETMEALLESVDCAWYTLDDRGQLDRIGGAVERLTGYAQSDFRRTPDLWWAILHPDDLTHVRSEARAGLKRGDGSGGDPLRYRLVHRRGGTVQVRETAIVARAGAGMTRAALVVGERAEDAALGGGDWFGATLDGRAAPPRPQRFDPFADPFAGPAPVLDPDVVEGHAIDADAAGRSLALARLGAPDDDAGDLALPPTAGGDLLGAVPAVFYSTPADRDEPDWLYVSPELEDRTGCAADEWTEALRPTGTGPLLPVEDRNRLRDELLAAAERPAGSVSVLDHDVRARDGSRVPVRHRWVGVAGRDGRVARWYGSVVDRTEAAELETRLTRTEQTLRTMLESTGDAIIMCAADGTLLAANELARTMLPLDPRHADRLPPSWTIVASDDGRLDATTGPATVAIRSGRQFAGRVELDRPEGDRIVLGFRAQPVGGRHDDAAPSVVVCFSDQTDAAAGELEHVRLLGERARRESAEQLVRDLQLAMLPAELPRVAGIGLAARYVAAAGGVGGDFYGASPLPGGRVGLVIGDVAGHGPNAASMAGTLNAAAQAYLLEGHGPAAVVDRLDRLVSPVPGATSSVLVALVSPDEGLVSFASAGHPPPLLRARDGSLRRLDGGTSSLLGVRANADREEATCAVDGGSALVLCTDGLIEDGMRSLDAGLERLVDALRRSDGTADDLCDRAVALVDRDGGPRDDVAVLACGVESSRDADLVLELDADPSQLATLRDGFDRWLSRLEPTRDEAYQLLLVTTEAVENAIEHAYGVEDGTVGVHATAEGRTVTVRVTDHGRWRSPRTSGRRRGLSLIRHLTDEVDIRTGEDGTELVMIRTLGEGSRAV